MNLVSIIIPCYNGSFVINQSIESVYIQDYQNIELIVVDDGSTDSSKEIIASWESRFAEKGSVLKYVYQENRGLGGAIDTGLKHITGQYLTLLDADDYYLPGSVSKKAKYLDEHSECVGVRSNGWMVRGEQKELFITSDEEKSITNLFDGLLFGKTNNWAGSYMIRTDVLFACYPDRNIYPSRFGQNMQILLPVAYGREFGYIDEPLMAYVLHEDSHSQARSPEEQYQKDEANQQGYRDIYLHMLDMILTDPAEHQKYRDIFDASYYRCAMLRAQKYSKQTQLEESFCALVKTGYATLNDKISYYNAIRSPYAFLLKLLRKINSLTGR
jgi:glycosyltransferase involved in cell wall biosynthesis